MGSRVSQTESENAKTGRSGPFARTQPLSRCAFGNRGVRWLYVSPAKILIWTVDVSRLGVVCLGGLGREHD